MENLQTWLTINRNCNLRCNWCYQGEMVKNGSTMHYQLAEKLIDLSLGLQAKNIILIGGEPTLHPRFLDIARCIRKKGIKVSVVSNSIKFADKSFVQQAEAIGIKAVNTSVKGSSGEEYLVSTGRNAFDLVKTALHNLKNSKIAQQVSITVSSSVVSNWKRMVEFIKESEVDNWVFSFEKPTITPNQIKFDEKMLPKNISEFIQHVMYPSLKQIGIKFKIELMFQQCVLNDGFVDQLEDEGHAFGGCLLMKCDKRIVFDPEGFVLPCNHFTMHPLGKYGEDFQDADGFIAWRQSAEVQKFYQTTMAAPGEKCAECDKWSKCGAGCRLYWLYCGSNKLLTSALTKKERR